MTASSCCRSEAGPGNDSNPPSGSARRRRWSCLGEEVFAADGYANRRVVVFDSETGAYKRHWGATAQTSDDKTRATIRPNAGAAIRQSGALHPHGQDGCSMCAIAPTTAAGFSPRRHVRFGHIFEKNTLGTGSVYDLVFSPDKEQKFIYMITA